MAAGYHAKYSLEVQFPAEVSSIRDPESKAVEDKHFTFSVSQFFRGNTAKVTLDLKTLADRIAVPDIPAFAQKVRSVNELGTGVIVVAKTEMRTDSARPSGIADRMRAMVQEAIDKTTETIKSGKLTGSDLGRAYCNRGTAYGYLGKLDEALAETAEALKLAPNSGELIACRAYVHLLRGEFAKSIADYNRAVTLGQTMPGTFRTRGIAKYYAGQLEEAAEDFKKALDADDKEEQSYNDLWLAWTNVRLSKPMDDASRARGEAQAHDDWPRPALAMFAGKFTPEEILKTLDTKTGDERDLALAEGYFYAGEYYLAHGDKEKAREFFTKTRALNVLPYVEHMCAGFELRFMNAAN
jgi:lipoprotein NlpI